jgi:hypothetical protein
VSQPELLPQPTGPKRRTRAVAVAAAAVVVLGGAVATYAAVSSSSAGGAASPQAAVQGLVNDLDNSDLLGVLNDLPPNERQSIGAPLQAALNDLEHAGIVSSGASLGHVPGIQFRASNLTFAPQNVTINDHVQIVELTGGTITVTGDAAKLPFTSEFFGLINHGAPVADTQKSSTVDLGQYVSAHGHPIRIATEESGGRWYPSLLYTIADNVTTARGLQAPSAEQRIPDVGASTPDLAVRTFIDALLHADVQRAFELLSPDELGVLHDYGKLITDRVHYTAPHITIKQLDLADRPGPNGTTLVGLTGLDLVYGNGREIRLAVSGQCASVTTNGDTKRTCIGQIVSQLSRRGPFGRPLTAAQSSALRDVFAGVQNVYGLEVVQVGGQWYLNPVHTYLNLFQSLLSGLHPGDVQALVSIFRP